MPFRDLFVLASLTLIAAAVASCGGSGSKSFRPAAESDLQAIVLQPADVPADYRRYDDANSGLGLQHKENELGSMAQFGVEYELSPDIAKSGDLSCIATSSLLYDTADAAAAGFQQGSDSLLGAGYDLVDESKVAINVYAYHAKSSSSVYCGGYENEAAESWTFLMTRANVVGALRVTYRTSGGSIEDAERYAKRQVEIMEAVLKG